MTNIPQEHKYKNLWQNVILSNRGIYKKDNASCQVEIISGIQSDFKILNTINHTNKVKEKKLYDYLNQCRKSIRQNSTPIHNKTYQNLEVVGNFLSLMKDITKICKLHVFFLKFNNCNTEKSQKTWMFFSGLSLISVTLFSNFLETLLFIYRIGTLLIP